MRQSGPLLRFHPANLGADSGTNSRMLQIQIESIPHSETRRAIIAPTHGISTTSKPAFPGNLVHHTEGDSES
jgi:hypothetical protein